MKRIIINNTVLQNNGDAAIVTALRNTLAEQGYEVTVATAQQDFVRRCYPGLRVCNDVLGYSWSYARRNVLVGNIAALFLLLSREYRQADILIGAPGGYLNSYYGFAWKLRIYRWAKLFGKRTVVFSQSVGPLNEKDVKILAKSSRYIDLVAARDSYSFNMATSSGFPASRLVLTPDAVFLKTFENSKESPASRDVGISVREWRRDSRSETTYTSLIVACVKLLLRSGYRVEFISTCQGVSGYTDDSVLASAIVERWFAEEKRDNRVFVDRRQYSVDDLEKKIRSYNFVVGTRLHMCLLSLINGVPAFNISYEIKGKESYGYLGFTDFSVDYNEPTDNAIKSLDRFIRNKEDIRVALPVVVRRLNAEAKTGLLQVMDLIGGSTKQKD